MTLGLNELAVPNVKQLLKTVLENSGSLGQTAGQ